MRWGIGVVIATLVLGFGSRSGRDFYLDALAARTRTGTPPARRVRHRRALPAQLEPRPVRGRAARRARRVPRRLFTARASPCAAARPARSISRRPRGVEPRSTFGGVAGFVARYANGLRVVGVVAQLPDPDRAGPSRRQHGVVAAARAARVSRRSSRSSSASAVSHGRPTDSRAGGQTSPTTCELLTVSARPSGSVTVNDEWMRPVVIADGSTSARDHSRCVASRSSTMRSNGTASPSAAISSVRQEDQVGPAAELEDRDVRAARRSACPGVSQNGPRRRRTSGAAQDRVHRSTMAGPSARVGAPSMGVQMWVQNRATCWQGCAAGVDRRWRTNRCSLRSLMPMPPHRPTMTTVEARPRQLTLGSALPRVDGFHPAVGTWFRRRFPDGPTPPQRDGWPRIAAGDDTLIAAPTGSGKTLAAFLAVHQPALPRARSRRAGRRHRTRRVRVAVEGARGRHRREPRTTAARDRGRSRASSVSTRPTSRSRCARATRPSAQRARMVRKPAELRRHDARVAVPAGHERERTRRAAHRSRP